MSNGNQSLPLSEPPRRALEQIISQYGTAVCETPTRVEGLLRDTCGEYRREINLLITALKDKVAVDLQSASVTPAELLIGRLTTRLRDNHSLTDDAARWAVESWAIALGRISRDQLPAAVIFTPTEVIPVLPPTAPVPYPQTHYAAPQQLQTQPAVWPPPVQGQPQGYQTGFPNTSGTLGPIPPEVLAMRWSWAAFFWNWLWMCNNGLAGARVLLFISCFIPYVNVISVIYLGLNGNQLAWQYRRFESVDHFKRVQSTWGQWALWMFLGTLAFELFIGLIGVIAGASGH